ncbi:MAG: GAF domain-containing protein [Anaerolineales bacterium]
MRRWSHSLLVRMLLSFVALALVGSTVLTLYAYVQARRTLTESIFQTLETTVRLKAGALDRWVDEQEADLLVVAQLSEVKSQAALLAAGDSESAAYGEAQERFADQLLNILAYQPDFASLYFLSPEEGQVLVATDRLWQGQYQDRARYFVEGRTGTYVQPVHESPLLDKATITIATPVQDEGGQLLGVLVAHLALDELETIMAEQGGGGRTLETYLLDSAGNVISADTLRYPVPPGGPSSIAVFATVVEQRSDRGLYENYAGEPVVGVYRWLDDQGVGLLAEVGQAEAFAPARRFAVLVSVSGVSAALLISLAIYYITLRVVRPIQAITVAATAIADGDLSRKAPVLTRDEVGTLARTFNRMTEELRNAQNSLEARVEERTQALAARSEQLQAAAEVARDAAAVSDVNRLLSTTVNLITQRFGFYHAGIFLVDDRHEYVVLRAASSEGGQRMLGRGYKLPIGQLGIVGYVADRGDPRIAMDVGDDAAFFDNPDLAETHSELAVPLKVVGEVIGVLDVQSTATEAFSEDDVAIMEIVADQLAVAIQNARLLEQSQMALREVERLYAQRSQELWRERLEQWQYAFRYTGVDVEALPLAQETPAPEADDVDRARVPLMLRGRQLGYIEVEQRPEQQGWTNEDFRTLEELGEQITLALDNARMIQESQQQAAREQLVAEITSRMRETLDVDTILRTAIRNIGSALNLSEVEVRMTSGVEGGARHEGAEAGDVPSRG